jgi:ParB family transcriptional regulator, chromosome partitioning protein
MNSGLGRGLSSLIPQKQNNEKKSDMNPSVDISTKGFVSDDREKILKINPNIIKVNPMQPRQRFAEYNLDELVESIKQYGIIQPLVITKSDGDYELIAGERRLRAAKMIGLSEVPVILRDAKEQEKLEIALVENLQRENLNPIETAVAYRKLIDEFNLSQEEVAKKIGKARTSVNNILRMLNLPEEIQLALIEGKIYEGHAKYIMGIIGEDKQMALFKKIIRNNLSVAETNNEARKMGGTKFAQVKINYADKEKEFVFRQYFGAKTEIRRTKKGGQIIINFNSDEELDGMAEKLK